VKWPHPGRFLFALFFALAVAGADEVRREGEFALRVWETDDGLSHNGVNSVVQGSDGFLWLATQSGVMRFDGAAFRKIHSPLLVDEKTFAIRTLVEIEPDTLLFAHDTSGLFRLQGGKVTVHPLTERIPSGHRISRLFVEGPDAFWVAFSNRDVWRCRGEQVEAFAGPGDLGTVWPFSFARAANGEVYVGRGVGVERYADGKLTPVSEVPAAPSTVCASRDGTVWVGSAERLGKLHAGKLEIVLSRPGWTLDWPPTTLMEDRAGTLWIGTRNQGAFRWDHGALQPVTTSYARTNEFLEDMEGNVWVATAGGGLNRLQRARFTLIGEEGGVLPDSVGSVCEDAQGRLWFGNRSCFGEVVNGRIQAQEMVEGFSKRGMPICADHEGNVWMASWARLGKFQANAARAPQWVEMENIGTIHALFASRDGSVWVGGETGPLVRFQRGTSTLHGAKEGYTSRRAQAIGETGDGDLWVGTDFGELFRLHAGRFVRYGSEAGLPASGIRAIHGDADGTVWIGTGGRGLFVWRHGNFRAITEVEGLPDDTISQIVEDDFGMLWFGSSRGLFKVRKSDLIACAEGRASRITPIIFGKADGVAGFSASANYQPSVCKMRDGQLWFATRKGLVSTMPDRQQLQPAGPRVVLENFEADGAAVDLANPIVPSSVRKLDFRFTAPAFSSPERVQFRHRLEGFDRTWTDTGTQRSASYSQLPAGRYVLRVAASNSDLVWNATEATLSFEVLPAWWETWTARVAAILLVVLVLILAVRYWSHRRLKAQLAELENRRRIDMERTRIARDLHDSLGASLTQAGMLAEELCEDCQDLEEMKAHSAQLAGRVRGIARDLDAAVWAVSPKNDTLASLSAYLCQFALEYFRDTPTRCRVHTGDDIPHTPLSPETRHHLFLTAREAMNNVLKHAHATEVRLTMQMNEGAFEMLLEDDGCGFDEALGPIENCNGLHNMRGRVAEIGGRFELQSSSRGTMVRVILPVKTSNSTPERPTLVH
jgi:signal transduction histidine kinase/ligand-binding sensor domain-containing protein